jgi:hypothetical protein
MSFWSKFAKFAIPIGAGLATVFTGGAAAPLLGMALGGGAGAAQGALSGGGWKGALKGGLIGGALGGAGGAAGGALKGIGGIGKALGQGLKYSKYISPALKAGRALAGGAPQSMGGPPQAPYPMDERPTPNPLALGYLNPIGLQPDRRTALAGMGTRYYA